MFCFALLKQESIPKQAIKKNKSQSWDIDLSYDNIPIEKMSKPYFHFKAFLIIALESKLALGKNL